MGILTFLGIAVYSLVKLTQNNPQSNFTSSLSGYLKKYGDDIKRQEEKLSNLKNRGVDVSDCERKLISIDNDNRNAMTYLRESDLDNCKQLSLKIRDRVQELKREISSLESLAAKASNPRKKNVIIDNISNATTPQNLREYKQWLTVWIKGYISDIDNMQIILNGINNIDTSYERDQVLKLKHECQKATSYLNNNEIDNCNQLCLKIKETKDFISNKLKSLKTLSDTLSEIKVLRNVLDYLNYANVVINSYEDEYRSLTEKIAFSLIDLNKQSSDEIRKINSDIHKGSRSILEKLKKLHIDTQYNCKLRAENLLKIGHACQCSGSVEKMNIVGLEPLLIQVNSIKDFSEIKSIKLLATTEKFIYDLNEKLNTDSLQLSSSINIKHQEICPQIKKLLSEIKDIKAILSDSNSFIIPEYFDLDKSVAQTSTDDAIIQTNTDIISNNQSNFMG